MLFELYKLHCNSTVTSYCYSTVTPQSLSQMSDIANRARFGVHFAAHFISVLVITETERKRAPNRARFATSDISLMDSFSNLCCKISHKRLSDGVNLLTHVLPPINVTISPPLKTRLDVGVCGR